MIAIDDNFKISENGGTGNATIFVSATDKNLFSTASTQVEVSTSVGGNIKRYVTLNKKAAHGYMYTPVEWISNEDIESRIWIDLGYVWKNNSRAQLGFVIPGTHQKPNGQQVFGEDTVWAADGNGPLDDTNDLRLFFTKTGSNIVAYWDVVNSRVQATVGAITDVWQNWEIGNNYIKNLSNNTNFVTGSTYSISRTGTVGLYGACQYLNTGRTDCVRYSYIKIYEGNTLIMDIIPVLDKDNIPCFFDKVGEQFYYYKVNGVPSTGLTAGNALQQLEYLQGDGSDYIVTDYIATSNTRIEADCSGRPASTPSSTEGAGKVMGCEKWNSSQPYGAQGGISIGFPGSGGVSFDYGTLSYANKTSQKIIERGVFKLDGSAAYIDDFKVADIITSFVTQGGPFALFNSLIYNSSNGTTFPISNFYSDAYYEGKIYGVKIYENNVLVRDYVPCAGTSTKGFYDRISGNYLTSVNGSLITGTVIGDLVISVIYDESDITISNETPSTAINVGTTFNLNASTTPTGATLSYSSSDTSIATVDSNGVITAVAEGTATITITAQGFNDDVNKVHYNTTSKTVSVECDGSIEYYLQGNREDYIIIPTPNDGDVIEIDYEGVLNSTGGLLAGSQVLIKKNSATMVDGGKWAYLGAGPINTNGSDFGVKYTGQTDNLSERRIVSIICSGQPSPSHYGIFTSYCKHSYTGAEGPICQVWGWGNIGGGVLGKVYSVNIYQNNTLVKNYLPYKDNNGVGLKEMISGNVYYSALNTLTFGS